MWPAENMRKMYLINQIVLFNPDDCSLTPRKSWPSGRVKLHAPAAECLQVLLAQNGLPVSQKLLFNQVWEKKGAVVSTNTLYQSIASVRKGLKAVGLEDEIIRTLPKHGFQCNASVQCGELADFIPPAAATIAPSLPESPTVTAVQTRTSLGQKIHTRYGLIIGGIIAVAMLTTVIYRENGTDALLPVPYYPAGQIENCEIHSSWSGKEYSQTVFNEIRRREPIDCRKKQLVYLTINRFQVGSSLILCDATMETKGVQCKAVILREDINENK